MVQPMYMQPSMMPRNQLPPLARPGTYMPPYMFGQGLAGQPPQMQLQSQVAPPSPGAFAVGPPPPSATVAGVIGQNSEQLMRMAAERRDREAREEQQRQMEEARSNAEATQTGAVIGNVIGTGLSLANPAFAPAIMPLANLAGTTAAQIATDQPVDAMAAVPQLTAASRGASAANKAQQAADREAAYDAWVMGLSDDDLNAWVEMPSHVARRMQSSGDFSIFNRYRKVAR